MTDGQYFYAVAVAVFAAAVVLEHLYVKHVNARRAAKLRRRGR